MTCLIFIGGQRLAAERVGVNSGLNFGRLDVAPRTVPMRLEAPMSALGWLAPQWRELALELAQDDLLDEQPSPLAALGYEPKLALAMTQPDAFAQAVEVFLARTILQRLCESPSDRATWIINGVTRVSACWGRLILEGWAVRGASR